MTERYHVVSTQDSPSTLDSSALADFLAKDGQLLLPMLDLIGNAQCAIDDLIDIMGRATIEAVLLMSAAQLAGPQQQGKKPDRDVVYHGSRKGHVPLKERDRVRRVKNWQSGSMALRWTAVAFDAIARGFRRIMGYKHLWMLKAALDEPSKDRSLVEHAKAG